MEKEYNRDIGVESDARTSGCMLGKARITNYKYLTALAVKLGVAGEIWSLSYKTGYSVRTLWLVRTRGKGRRVVRI